MCPLPAAHSDVAKYLGFLWEEGRVAPTSWDQYVSAINMIHAFNGLLPPGKHPLVREIVTAGKKAMDKQAQPGLVRGGVPASAIRDICLWGLAADSLSNLRDAAMLVLTFCCAAREGSVRRMGRKDLVVEHGMATITLVHRKGKPTATPHVLQYQWSARHGATGPLALWQRWLARFSPSGPLTGGDGSLWRLPNDSTQRALLPPQVLTGMLNRVLPLVQRRPPAGYQYSSHSLRIGASTSMQLLGVPDATIVRRLDWTVGGALLQLYFDDTHSKGESDLWVFSQLLPVDLRSDTP